MRMMVIWCTDRPRITLLTVLVVKSLVPRVSGFLSNREIDAGLVVRVRGW